MRRKLNIEKLNIRAIIGNSDKSISLFAPHLAKKIKQPKKIKRLFNKKDLYLSR